MVTQPFFDRLSQIDRVLSTGPDQVDVNNDLRPLLLEEASERYLFETLSDAAWLQPLRRAGFFVNPPDPTPNGDGTANIPVWPQSRFLVRMASQDPEQVLRIILNVSNTTNGLVHEDFIDAARKMPPDLASQLVEPAIQWLRSSSWVWQLPDKLGDLTKHLSDGGQIAPALELAEALLEVLPDPQARSKDSDQSMFAREPIPRPHFQVSHYRTILKKYVPALVVAAPLQMLRLLCKLLDDALCLSRTRTEEAEPCDDYSYIWREAIEEDEPEYHDTLKDCLVSALRDSSEQLLSLGVPLKEVLDCLGSHRWPVFDRLAMHLLRTFESADHGLIAGRLLDSERFNSIGVRHEYMLLLKSKFKDLQPDDRQTILGYIQKWPSWIDRNEKEAKVRRDVWQRDWLSIIANDLTPQWQHRYKQLVQALGPSDQPDRPFRIHGAVWAGPTSPKSEDELRSMGDEELLDFLQTWSSDGGPYSASKEGLARALAAAVTSHPRRFAAQMSMLRQVLEPTYHRTFFDGFRNALKEKKLLRWELILDHAAWVLSLPRQVPGRAANSHREEDPDWSWTIHSIAHLLNDGLSQNRGRLPIRLRKNVWQLIEVLAEDPEPAALEEEHEGSGMEPFTESLNTIRGEAIHAVIRYALWVRQRLDKRKNREQLLALGFDAVPEARKVLENHLDPEHDASPAIRAVYGQWLPQLVLMDKEWTRRNIERIFPVADDQRHLCDAAWKSYVGFSQLYGSVYDVIECQYKRAITRVGSERVEDRQYINADQRLGEHLMVLYWWGRIGLGELSQFFGRASADLRQHTLVFVGHSLSADERKPSADEAERLQELWEWRLSQVASESPAARRTELSAFGWWFVSKRLPEDWARSQLKAVLELTHWVEPDRDVVEGVVELARQKPALAVELAGLMAEGANEGWIIRWGWRESLRSILELALKSSDETAKQLATNLLNRLGELGLVSEYRNLYDSCCM